MLISKGKKYIQKDKYCIVKTLNIENWLDFYPDALYKGSLLSIGEIF